MNGLTDSHREGVTLPPLSDGYSLEMGRFRTVLLTAFDVLARRQVTERAVGTLVIVIVAPGVQ